MECPRKNCDNEAILNRVYGVLPCKKCVEGDPKIGFTKPLTYSLAKSHRIQKAQDVHSADLLQPFLSDKPNKDYFLKHPDQIDKHGVRSELKKV